MQLNRLTGSLFAAMLKGAAARLLAEQGRIDALNVFPVPDGDTGSNMAATLVAAAAAVDRLPHTDDLSVVAATAARGALMGARGNSGVILSQFLAGVAEGLQGVRTAGPVEVTLAMERAAARGYASVSNPADGTMLSVCRAAAEAGRAALCSGEATLASVAEAAILAAAQAVRKSPELLPVLAKAGVVDAGGHGVLLAAVGALLSVEGLDDQFVSTLRGLPQTVNGRANAADWEHVPGHGISETEITFRYCTEFLVTGKDLPLDRWRKELATLGDSLLVVGDSETAKVHVHTNHPGKALELCGASGDLSNVSVSNMVLQNRDAARRSAPAPRPVQPDNDIGAAGKVSFLAVASGDGFEQLLREAGAAAVVRSESSTLGDLVASLRDAIASTAARDVVVLANRPDALVLEAALDQLAGRKVQVLATASEPEGIAALLAMDTQPTAEQAVEAGRAATGTVKLGAVKWEATGSGMGEPFAQTPRAVAVVKDTVVAHARTIPEAAVRLAQHLRPGPGSVLTLYTSQETTNGDVQALIAHLQAALPGLEIAALWGGQSDSYCLLAVE